MSQNTIPKVKGVRYDFGGGVEYVIPPLNLRSLEHLGEKLNNIDGSDMLTQIKTIGEAAHLAIQRNYPEVTKEQVDELIDVGNMLDVMACVMDVSGMKRKSQEAGDQDNLGKATLLDGDSSTQK